LAFHFGSHFDSHNGSSTGSGFLTNYDDFPTSSTEHIVSQQSRGLKLSNLGDLKIRANTAVKIFKKSNMGSRLTRKGKASDPSVEPNTGPGEYAISYQYGSPFDLHTGSPTDPPTDSTTAPPTAPPNDPLADPPTDPPSAPPTVSLPGPSTNSNNPTNYDKFSTDSADQTDTQKSSGLILTVQTNLPDLETRASTPVKARTRTGALEL